MESVVEQARLSIFASLHLVERGVPFSLLSSRGKDRMGVTCPQSTMVNKSSDTTPSTTLGQET